MPLRNVPITYTLDQQRQEINNLANDVNDIDINFNEKIDDRINGLITAGTGISAVYDDTGNTYTLALDFTEFNTTNLTEGVNGLFYTSARAISEIDNRVTKTFLNNLEITELGNLAELNLQSGSDSATVTASNYNHNNWDTAFAWGNHASAGYITSVGAIALNDISDVNVSGIVTDGHVLKWDGGTSRWIAAPDLSGGGGGGGGGISLTDLSASSNSASGGGAFSYNNVSGQFTYTPPDLSSFSTFSGDWGDLTNKPSIPSSLNDLGDVDTTGAANDKILKHNGTSWVVADDATGGGGSGTSVTVSDTAPTSPSAGDLWFKSDEGRLKIYYNDGSSSQWVDTSPIGSGGGGGGASVTTDDTAPSSPSDGDLWWKSNEGQLKVYYQDADSSQWVDVGGGFTGMTLRVFQDVVAASSDFADFKTKVAAL